MTRDAINTVFQSGKKTRDYAKTLSMSALQELKTWGLFKEPNWWFIFFNAIEVVAALAIVVIGFVVVQEARDDFINNSADRLGKTTITPCGFPGPDMLHLLRTAGVYEHDFLLPQLIEPRYDKWLVKAQGPLCVTRPYWESVGNDGEQSGGQEDIDNKARKLNALAMIMGKKELYPNLMVDPADLTSKEEAMLDAICSTELGSMYSNRLLTAFGDPLTRIARAYLAAAPAFRAYAKSKAANPGSSCLEDFDPFGADSCGNADYIQFVLDRAGSVGASSRLSGVDDATAFNSDVPDILEQFVALFALSVINHWDRTLNYGNCFGNPGSPPQTALEMCGTLYDDDTFAGTLPTETSSREASKSINLYITADEPLSQTFHCSARDDEPKYPPPPPPWQTVWGTASNALTTIGEHVKATCASMLNYGLYDQERLFGVPDVLFPFQDDNRPGANFHFLGLLTSGPLWNNILDEDPSTWAEPLRRLELYLAYRLAALSIWGSLIAIVTGFFMGRSGAPLTVAIIGQVLRLKDRGGRPIQIVQPNSRSISSDTYTKAAAFFAIVAGYYTLYVDPGAQSYYPTTPECGDWVLGDDYTHSSGGAYVTSWGMRRFNRYSENQVGIAVALLVVIPIVFQLTTPLVKTRAQLKDRQDAGPAAVKSVVVYIYPLVAIVIIGAQIGNCVLSGYSWRNAAVNAPMLADAEAVTLGRDCLACVLMSFWLGLAVSVGRCSWAISSLAPQWRIAFFGGVAFLAWLSQISYLAILPDEYAKAFAYPSDDEDRLIPQLLILGGCIFYTGLVVAEWYLLRMKLGGAGGNAAAKLDEAEANAATAAEEELKQRQLQEELEQAGFYQYEDLSAPVREFKFNLGAVRIGGADATGRTGAAAAAALARLPLPRAQRVAPAGSRPRGRYMPMLKLGH